MSRMLRRRGLGAGVTVAVIVLGGVRPLLAQVPPAAPAAQARQPTAASQPTQQLGGLITRYLVDSPQVLNLTPKQVVRVRKQLARVDSADAPLRAQWQQIAGGRSLRDLTPVERRRLGPQLQPIMQQLRTNNQAALDSVDAILTPEQQARLAALRAEYGQRVQARRARPGQQP